MTDHIGTTLDTTDKEVYSLRKCLEEFSKQCCKENRQILRLTYVLVGLMGVITILVGLQFYFTVISR
jgi:hypothetical protein